MYWYEYDAEDKAVLQACATDLRPFSFSFLPAGAAYYGLGKLVRNPKQVPLCRCRALLCHCLDGVPPGRGRYQHCRCLSPHHCRLTAQPLCLLLPPSLLLCRQLGMMTRASLLLLRLAAASEVFRVGYLVGSYKQGYDCTQRLVSLRSALGGEISAIIRERVGGLAGLAGRRDPAWLPARAWLKAGAGCGCY